MRVMKRVLFAVALPILLTLCALPCRAQLIKGAGCPTEYFLIKDVAEAYQAKTGKVILPGRNNNKIGLTLLSQGRVDFAFCCDHHCNIVKGLDFAPEVYRNWLSLPVAMDPLIIVVHKDLPIESLTLNQLRDIYFGTTANWRELGGPDLPMQPGAMANSAESGLALVFREQILPKTGSAQWSSLPYNGNVTVFSNEDNPMRDSILTNMIFNVRKNPGSIGYFGYGAYNKKFGKILKINGIAPSRENILNGTYPLAARYYIVYDRTNSDKIRDFLDFLKSAEGQQAINANFTGLVLPAESCDAVTVETR